MLERFYVKARQEPKQGLLWEIYLLPQNGQEGLRRPVVRRLASASAPQTIAWLRELLRAYLKKTNSQAGENFGPQSPAVDLTPENGMRLALAFASARYLATPDKRRAFVRHLNELSPEVLLYWFTQCFYGRRTAAARAALRALLTYAHDDARRAPPVSGRHAPGGLRPTEDPGPFEPAEEV